MSEPIRIEVRAEAFDERLVRLTRAGATNPLNAHRISLHNTRLIVYMPERFHVMWACVAVLSDTQDITHHRFAGPFKSAGQLLAYAAFRHSIVVSKAAMRSE